MEQEISVEAQDQSCQSASSMNIINPKAWWKSWWESNYLCIRLVSKYQLHIFEYTLCD